MDRIVLDDILDAIALEAFKQGAEKPAEDFLRALDALSRKERKLYMELEALANAYAHGYADAAARVAWEAATDLKRLVALRSAW